MPVAYTDASDPTTPWHCCILCRLIRYDNEETWEEALKRKRYEGYGNGVPDVCPKCLPMVEEMCEETRKREDE